MFTKPKRRVDRVFIHCSASDALGAAYEKQGLVNTINSWHLARGFAGIGYHFVIDKAGNIMTGRNIEKIPAAQEGNNTNTIAICLHGLEDRKFTIQQEASLRALCAEINLAYNGSVTFHGHREVNKNKTCPVFDYRKWLGLDGYGRIPKGK